MPILTLKKAIDTEQEVWNEWCASSKRLQFRRMEVCKRLHARLMKVIAWHTNKLLAVHMKGG